MTDFLTLVNPQAMQDQRRRRLELGNDIVAASHQRGDFVLSSGVRTHFFFDKYLFVTKPTVLRRIASMLAERLPAGVDRIAGAGFGGVALATAIALESGLPYVVLRAAGARDGRPVRVEGELHAGEQVGLIEDVVKTGRAAVLTANTLRRAGASIARVTAVIDCAEGAESALAAHGLELDALFTISDLLGDQGTNL